MKRGKGHLLSPKDQQETEFEWNEFEYDIVLKSDVAHPSMSIEQLREQSRKFWEEEESIREEWNRLSPLEQASQRTEAARNRLEGKSTSHISPWALRVDKEMFIVMKFKIISCINGYYSGELTAWTSVSKEERDLLKQLYQTDSDPCACKELRELYERVIKTGLEDAKPVSTEYSWNSKPVTFFFGVPDEICSECRRESRNEEESEYQAIFDVFERTRGQPARYQDKEIQADNRKQLFHNWLYERYAETSSVEKELALFFKQQTENGRCGSEYENTSDWYLNFLFDTEDDEFVKTFRRIWPAYDGWRYVEHKTTLVLEHGIVRTKGLWEDIRQLPVPDRGVNLDEYWNDEQGPNSVEASHWHKKRFTQI